MQSGLGAVRLQRESSVCPRSLRGGGVAGVGDRSRFAMESNSGSGGARRAAESLRRASSLVDERPIASSGLAQAPGASATLREPGRERKGPDASEGCGSRGCVGEAWPKRPSAVRKFGQFWLRRALSEELVEFGCGLAWILDRKDASQRVHRRVNVLLLGCEFAE